MKNYKTYNINGTRGTIKELIDAGLIVAKETCTSTHKNSQDDRNDFSINHFLITHDGGWIDISPFVFKKYNLKDITIDFNKDRIGSRYQRKTQFNKILDYRTKFKKEYLENQENQKIDFNKYINFRFYDVVIENI